MNWLDVCLWAGIILCVASGLARGFTRTAIGFCSAWLGVLAGLWLYRSMGFWMRPYVSSKPLANAAGFAVVFVAVALAGAALERLRQRYYPAPNTLAVDRVLGGAFGLVRGVLLATIWVLLLLAFWPHLLAPSLRESLTVPYLTRTAQVLAQAAPDEIRDGFRAARRDLETAPLPDAVKAGLARLE
jgi:membrane protein required for colicin V production